MCTMYHHHTAVNDQINIIQVSYFCNLALEPRHWHLNTHHSQSGCWTKTFALTSFTIWLLDQNICTHYRYSQSGCWTKTFAHTIPDILQVQITILHIQNLNLWLWYYETSAQCRHWTKTLSCIHHSQSGSWTTLMHTSLTIWLLDQTLTCTSKTTWLKYQTLSLVSY